MKDYRKSDYAKNKMNKIAIVYSHNGCTEILTYEKASTSDPNITREEFEKFKKISDEMFHEIFKNDDKESNHVVAVFNEDIVDDILNMLSPEDEYIANEETKEKRRKIKMALSKLTDVQLRRIKKYLKGMTMEAISIEEGCSINAIKKSIHKVRKIFSTFFPERGLKNGDFHPIK